MEIVDQIIEDYKVIDYEYWQDYTLKKRKIWQIERNIKRLRKELGFSNKVKISNLKIWNQRGVDKSVRLFLIVLRG